VLPVMVRFDRGRGGRRTGGLSRCRGREVRLLLPGVEHHRGGAELQVVLAPRVVVVVVVNVGGRRREVVRVVRGHRGGASSERGHHTDALTPAMHRKVRMRMKRMENL